MKKAIALIAAVILFAFCAVPAFAAECIVPGEQKIGVYAKAVYSPPDGCYSAKEDGGDYIVTLPDGSKITVTPKTPDPSLRLVGYPVTEKDDKAYRWFLEHTVKLGANPTFYDIYFTNEYGVRVDIKTNAEVIITLPKNYGTPKVAALSASGESTLLDAKSQDNVVCFTIEEGGYYAVAAAYNSSGTGASGSPQTGDSSNLRLWFVLLVLSGVSLIYMSVYGKKQKSE